MLVAPVVELAFPAVLQPRPDVAHRLGHGPRPQARLLRPRRVDAEGALVTRRQPQRELGPRLDVRLLELLVRDPDELGVPRGLQQLAERRLPDRPGAVERPPGLRFGE